MTRRTKAAIAIAFVALALAPAAADAKYWVIRGHGFGHGVGMSSYGSYGFARHGRTYGQIMHHYYRGTHLGHVKGKHVRVLLSAGSGAVTFSKANAACGRHLRPRSAYRFAATASGVALQNAAGRTLTGCGHRGVASGGPIHVHGQGTYRGRLIAHGGGSIELVNKVGLEGYTKAVVPSEVFPSWPQPALRAEAVAARTFALAAVHGGRFDVYDDTRSQVYGGKGKETPSTTRAVDASKGKIVKYHQAVATTMYSSSSGGYTESIQNAFIGSSPVPYLKGVKDPYDGVSPLHTWKLPDLSEGGVASKLAGLFSGALKRIKVLKRGVSPRIVYARVVGSRGSSRVTGPELASRLGTYSSWIHFRQRRGKAPVSAKSAEPPPPPALPAGTGGP
jgi:stage II sporulation protein D